jgi:serpin B
MSRKVAVSAVVGFALWITGCSGTASSMPPDKPVERDRRALKEQVAAVVEADNRFAFDLYQRLRADESNLFFSPASISMALAMTYAGAAESTAAEMAKTLHFEMPKAQLDEEMRALRTSWNTNNKKQGFRLDVANRLWGQEGYHFRPEFLRVSRTDYGAELGQLDFRSEAEKARQTINAWVEDHTGQKITNLIPSAEALRDARLVLTNAVYFKGEWQEPFDKGWTKNEDFHVSADRKIKAPMMHKQDDFRYAHVEGLQLLELSYGDRSLSMVVLLPETVGKLSQLEEKLTTANLQNWTERLDSQEVIVYLPKFKTTSQFQLSDTLKAMGMVSAFDAGTADFSGMTGNRDLFISAVIHKAFVDVSEEGTEAAAATAVVAVPTAAPFRTEPKKPPVFRADHPYVFLIRDNRNGAILFLGRIIDPTK